MTPRHPAGYQYPNQKPARYTDSKTSTYFTKSGITQLGYIRSQLEALQNACPPHEITRNCIDQLIKLIDGLADKSPGSSLKVAMRIMKLDEDFMRIFPERYGAIVFDNTTLFDAAKIIVQGVAAIQPEDLDPPKQLFIAAGISKATVCKTIQSAMNAINAQILFFLQLRENAEASMASYENYKATLKIAKSLKFNIDYIDNEFVDHQIKDSSNLANVGDVLEQVNTALGLARECLQQYIESTCSSITLETGRDAQLTPLETYELALKNPGCLGYLHENGSNIDNILIKPAFMLISVPNELRRLSKIIGGILNNARKHLSIKSVEANAPIWGLLQACETECKTLVIGIKKALQGKAGAATLKDSLNNFKTDFLLPALNDYSQSAQDQGKTTEDNHKLNICTTLANNINKIDLDYNFRPQVQFIQYISSVASAFYDHNAICSRYAKSPGNLGEILKRAMNDLANMSKNLCANDSASYDSIIKRLDDLLGITPNNPANCNCL